MTRAEQIKSMNRQQWESLVDRYARTDAAADDVAIIENDPSVRRLMLTSLEGLARVLEVSVKQCEAKAQAANFDAHDQYDALVRLARQQTGALAVLRGVVSRLAELRWYEARSAA